MTLSIRYVITFSLSRLVVHWALPTLSHFQLQSAGLIAVSVVYICTLVSFFRSLPYQHYHSLAVALNVGGSAFWMIILGPFLDTQLSS
ncbi:uncharacterized protein EDB91DRAFT_1096045 [Suillus paluster]|uniref:uncharacterized protein n=1 Tax=Suillus paluster TaxID=48578 RepID=UPI001B86BCF6|nr:uncharacterized protein EDB91DRAFT_1096045 [Suillus paluster]KAG1754896.1 hypothetical protein EDB91DRAFT_1096045 [Suillus paluster]